MLYPLATQQIEIDLDDGVKVNYPKFGEALKKIPGAVGWKEKELHAHSSTDNSNDSGGEQFVAGTWMPV